MSSSNIIFLIVFILLICIATIIDLGLFRKRGGKDLSFKQAGMRMIIWVVLGLSFAIFVYFFHATLHDLQTAADFLKYKSDYRANFAISQDLAKTQHNFGMEAVLLYITGYFIEYSLSLDNLFVIMLIFSSFKVRGSDQKSILMWGVIGAIVMRFLFVFLGGTLLAKFHWLLYLFGLFLLYSGIKLLVHKTDENEKIDTHRHPVVRFISWLFPVDNEPNPYGKFFTVKNGKRYVTTLFVVLLVVEFSDVVFAVDSVPAIFGITLDPFIVFFSNIFAIMGLRSLFFLLNHSVQKFKSLHYGLSLVLIFIGFKMIFESWFHTIGFTPVHNLIVLFSILTITFIYGFIFPKK